MKTRGCQSVINSPYAARRVSSHAGLPCDEMCTLWTICTNVIIVEKLGIWLEEAGSLPLIKEEKCHLWWPISSCLASDYFKTKNVIFLPTSKEREREKRPYLISKPNPNVSFHKLPIFLLLSITVWFFNYFSCSTPHYSFAYKITSLAGIVKAGEIQRQGGKKSIISELGKG